MLTRQEMRDRISFLENEVKWLRDLLIAEGFAKEWLKYPPEDDDDVEPEGAVQTQE
jgi:hypothetical protein